MPSTIPQRPVRIKDRLYFKLRYIAGSNAQSFNKEVVSVLQHHVEQYEKENGKISLNDLQQIFG